ncbi:hypothetical protein L0128_20840 [candidate division KSB1 bacterium]|nr:hypothetical protein [candidate division KSB1 bacterium]
MSYRTILNSPTPLRFDALAEFSAEWQQKILDIIQTEPLAHFLGIEYSAPGKPPLLYVKKVFNPEIIQIAA